VETLASLLQAFLQESLCASYRQSNEIEGKSWVNRIEILMKSSGNITELTPASFQQAFLLEFRFVSYGNIMENQIEIV
jgi:hypothetical protein